ncbi:hypothetical protein BS50DRAFT_27157 [Corynespora cassiicola Philippines]|uniref:Uncharacterized protein n=1 Tax=Corynespora cassiicola Philippines TaxID=1448308 RepID=A0A2T2PBK4_CORCC|nr:hypothetical protein BS50DRAFT_27157 [Corynespora cassiicola Philippines]
MTNWDLVYYVLRANVDGVPSAYCTIPYLLPGHGGGQAPLWVQSHSNQGSGCYCGRSIREGRWTAWRHDSRFPHWRRSPKSHHPLHPRASCVANVRRLRRLARHRSRRRRLADDRAAFSERFTFFHACGI